MIQRDIPKIEKTPEPITPLYDTWYGDEEVFANYGGYDGDNEEDDDE